MKQEENDNLKQLFHDKLYNHSSNVSPDGWENLRKQLTAQKPKRKNAYWLYGALAGVAAAVLLLFVFIGKQPQNINVKNIAQTQQTSDSIKQNNIEKTPQNIIDDNKNIAQTDNNIENNANKNKSTTHTLHKNINTKNNKNETYTNTQTKNNTQHKIENSENTNDNNIKQNTNLIANADSIKNTNIEKFEQKKYSTNNPNSTKTDLKDKIETPAERNKETIADSSIIDKTGTSTKIRKTLNNDNDKRYWAEAAENEDEKTSNSKWQLALAYNQNFNSTSNNYTNKLYSNNVYSLQKLAVMSDNVNAKDNTIETYVATKQVELKHRPPITVGVKARKSVNNRLSLRAGISYSFFYSNLKNSEVKVLQRLHYIGVPVGAEYNLIKANRFNIYIAGDFVAEKGVRCEYEEKTVTNIGKEYDIKTSHSVRGIQFSANGSVGVSYSVSKLIDIYAEPGAVYYIKDKRQPESIRTEKPLNFAVGVGLKVNF